MGRFHQSMSWNHCDKSGSEPHESSSEESDSPSGEDWHSNVDGPNAGSHFSAQTWPRLTSRHSFFLPVHYTPSYHYPLIIWLHSNGFNENQVDHVMPHISVRNHLGVGIRATKAVDNLGHRFDWHHSPAGIAAAQEAVAEAIEDACERFSVHNSRIVLAGYREGGTMALRLAMREPERFAGVISLGGRMPKGSIRNLHQLRERRLPMLWQWGRENDQYTDVNLKADCRMTMAIGGRVEVRQYPGDDEMDTIVLRDVDDWIMRRIVAESTIADSDRWSTSPTLYSSN